jgi:hypothetical protein
LTSEKYGMEGGPLREAVGGYFSIKTSIPNNEKRYRESLEIAFTIINWRLILKPPREAT